MGKTIKRYPFHMFRHPKGQKRALANNERTIPPCSRDDGYHSKPCYIPYKVAYGMLIKKKPVQQVVDHLVKKFKMTRKQANRVVAFTLRKLGNNDVECFAGIRS